MNHRLDRDQAARILYGRGLVPADRVTEVLDALEACVVENPRTLAPEGWVFCPACGSLIPESVSEEEG